MIEPDEPVIYSAKAPRTIEYNGNIYYRLGRTKMTYVSKFYTDLRGFWSLASLYYNPERNSVLEYTCDGHLSESAFLSETEIKLFEDLGNNKVMWSRNYFRYKEFYTTIIFKRMSFLNLKPKNI